MKTRVLPFLLICGSLPWMIPDSRAEETPVFSFAGSLNLAYGTSEIAYGGKPSHAMYLNFGGPILTLVSGEAGFGASFFPSLKVILSPAHNVNAASTALGVGPWISFHKVVISMPVYFTSAAATDVGVGLGYRF